MVFMEQWREVSVGAGARLAWRDRDVVEEEFNEHEYDDQPEDEAEKNQRGDEPEDEAEKNQRGDEPEDEADEAFGAGDYGAELEG
jgi:hypothetical protein